MSDPAPAAAPWIDPPAPQRRAAAATLAPLPVLLLPWLVGSGGWVQLLGLLVGLLLAGGALLAARRPGLGLLFGLLAAAGFILGGLPALAGEPGLTLTALLAWGLGLVWAFQLLDPPGTRRPELRAPVSTLDLARGACAGALASWALAVPVQLGQGLAGGLATASALLGAGAAALVWARGYRVGGRSGGTPAGGPTPLRLLVGVAAPALFLALGALQLGSPETSLTLLALPAAAGLVVTSLARRAPAWEGGAWWEPVLEDPARLLVATFLLTGGLGGLLLALPAASADGQGVALVDAWFTAFSASCVTGLTTLDTETAWSGLGQALILLLIQVGGLGIMTFSTAGLVLLGRKLSLRQEGAVLATLNQEDRRRLSSALFLTVGLTLVVEAAGALILAALFALEGRPLGQAVWFGVFHSVSAYCNAGFGLLGQNLVPWQARPLVLHTVAALIILGGLGPILVADLPRLLRRQRVSVQTKLALLVTAGLLLAPALLFLVVEGGASMDHLSTWHRLHNAWFFAVTPRTAGFNSVDLTAISTPTLTITMVLMFVGGCPGSTAGGIKTTTLGLLGLAVIGALRGRADAQAFGFRISQASIYKAVATTAMGMVSVLVATLALLLTQDLSFQLALFEAVSALGTVGLTIGATPLLDSVGKVIVIACMFAGRVGPLSLFLLLAERQADTAWGRPEQGVAVG